nr:hypothetical protein Iba_chr08cCG13620 [Ipomoea batatas]
MFPHAEIDEDAATHAAIRSVSPARFLVRLYHQQESVPRSALHPMQFPVQVPSAASHNPNDLHQPLSPSPTPNHVSPAASPIVDTSSATSQNSSPNSPLHEVAAVSQNSSHESPNISHRVDSLSSASQRGSSLSPPRSTAEVSESHISSDTHSASSHSHVAPTSSPPPSSSTLAAFSNPSSQPTATPQQVLRRSTRVRRPNPKQLQDIDSHWEDGPSVLTLVEQSSEAWNGVLTDRY